MAVQRHVPAQRHTAVELARISAADRGEMGILAVVGKSTADEPVSAQRSCLTIMMNGSGNTRSRVILPRTPFGCHTYSTNLKHAWMLRASRASAHPLLHTHMLYSQHYPRCNIGYRGNEGRPHSPPSFCLGMTPSLPLAYVTHRPEEDLVSLLSTVPKTHISCLQIL